MSDNEQFKLGNPVHFLALGFGSGLLKPAPGTWGTLVAVPLYVVWHSAVGGNHVAYLTLILIAFALGIFLCGKAAADVGVADHGAIVWDEIVGFFVTMAALPPTMLNIILGFALFRLFDIWKPWPIRLVDKSVHGGTGIMLDDVIAGVFACALLNAVQPLL